jgi:hypothetical protein
MSSRILLGCAALLVATPALAQPNGAAPATASAYAPAGSPPNSVGGGINATLAAGVTPVDPSAGATTSAPTMPAGPPASSQKPKPRARSGPAAAGQ